MFLLLDTDDENQKLINIDVEEKPTGQIIRCRRSIGTSTSFGVENNFLGAIKLNLFDPMGKYKAILLLNQTIKIQIKLFNAKAQETDRMMILIKSMTRF